MPCHATPPYPWNHKMHFIRNQNTVTCLDHAKTKCRVRNPPVTAFWNDNWRLAKKKKISKHLKVRFPWEDWWLDLVSEMESAVQHYRMQNLTTTEQIPGNPAFWQHSLPVFSIWTETEAYTHDAPTLRLASPPTHSHTGYFKGVPEQAPGFGD